ncbi:cytochrome b/b6 domain-containing protein [Desulfofustis glycolicus]|uniref:Cytochrome b n=1 Tax=Desulfofustis glycolicus DSM 9705 TaxID=1121409 RepID=A0A1M5S159_9BACT|nr:cytochrome b/b6 domain-containing protein [Desulfofustis glycolicus]MCB2216275.1 cytochrome b/b6 domain-containing protein [Desulfobulbaceae bacterium]SHH32194.1 Cytochrome b [Desulfofustis glycolicus DSM 9705]
MKGNDTLVVWDPFIRVFHWSLVLLFIAAYATGDDDSSAHRYVGYLLLILISLRILWGFIGSTHARFSDFAYSPRAALLYLKDLITGKPKYYRGHNPASSWMVYLFIIHIVVLGITGYAAFSAKQHKPLAAIETNFSLVANAYADDDDFADRDKRHGGHKRNHANSENDADDRDTIWEDIHEGAAYSMLFLVFLHVAGAIASSIRHGENLILSMVNGKKRSFEAR